MCFGKHNPDFCHTTYDGKNFETSVRSKCEHFSTDGLAIYNGSFLTTGSKIEDCYVTSEIFNIETDQWIDAPDYPFHG